MQKILSPAYYCRCSLLFVFSARGHEMPKDSASDDLDVTKSRGAFRPDLSQSTTRSNDTDRILSSLGSSKGAFSSGSPKSKTSVFTFAVLMLISAGAAVLGYQYFANQTNTASSPATLPKTADLAAVAKAETVAKESVAGAGLPAQAAEIVNELPAPKKPKEPTTNAQTQLTDALEKDVKPPSAALEKALESKPGAQVRPGAESAPKTASAVTVKSSGTGDTGTASASTSTKDLNASSKDGVKTSKTTVASSSSNSNSKQSSGGAGIKASTNTIAAGDKDINLIAALLSHNAASQNAARSTGVKSDTSAKPDVQVKNTNSNAAAEASLKTTGATPVQSSLKQCEGLDFFQREICRLKTCDKLWESDLACKATLTSTR